MKILRATISVEAEDDVTREMLRAILANHLWFALEETAGGRVLWKKVRVSVQPEGEAAPSGRPIE